MAIQKSENPSEFLAFEQDGWAAQIKGYNDTLGTVTRQTVEAVLDAARITPGARVLDVCCGPGMLSAAAIARGAKAVGLDFHDVVALARELVPGADFQSGDATELPFADGSFDAVVCGYGILHVPDPETALREMVRVLRPGGRVVLSVWDNETKPTGLGLVYQAVLAHADLGIPLPHGPNIFQFSTLEAMRDALSSVDLAEVDALSHAQSWQVRSSRHFLDAVCEGTVRTRAVLAGQTPDVIAKIAAFFEDGLAGMRLDDGGFDVPMPAIIGSGTKRMA